ncbi:hypothetical protein [Ravibacter arvi]
MERSGTEGSPVAIKSLLKGIGCREREIPRAPWMPLLPIDLQCHT